MYSKCKTFFLSVLVLAGSAAVAADSDVSVKAALLLREKIGSGSVKPKLLTLSAGDWPSDWDGAFSVKERVALSLESDVVSAEGLLMFPKGTILYGHRANPSTEKLMLINLCWAVMPPHSVRPLNIHFFPSGLVISVSSLSRK